MPDQDLSATILRKAASVEGLILDVDGTLTDGSLIMGVRGEAVKIFHVRDGLGIRLLIRSGLRTAVISGRSSRIVARRSRELGIHWVFQGMEDKLSALDELLRVSRIPSSRWAAVGDDLLDLPLLAKVGFAVGVGDCVPELDRVIHYKTRCRGGRGAVREVCELILKARNQWPY